MKRGRFISFLVLGLLLPTATAAASIDVPFTAQAPFANWAEPWQNACEEASIVMVDNYYSGEVLTPEIAHDDIITVLRNKEASLGWSLDETAAEVAFLINTYMDWHAVVVENPTVEQIKSEIDAKRPVILPVYGKELPNPHFRGAPSYHMVVISGYNDASRMFITQEPGTRHGRDFEYSYEMVMDAMHDFLPGNTQNGEKVVIYTSPAAMTVAAFEGALIKSTDSSKVYLVENGKKRHIATESVFYTYGWDWRDIQTVSPGIANQLVTGRMIF